MIVCSINIIKDSSYTKDTTGSQITHKSTSNVKTKVFNVLIVFITSVTLLQVTQFSKTDFPSTPSPFNRML